MKYGRDARYFLTSQETLQNRSVFELILGPDNFLAMLFYNQFLRQKTPISGILRVFGKILKYFNDGAISASLFYLQHWYFLWLLTEFNDSKSLHYHFYIITIVIKTLSSVSCLQYCHNFPGSQNSLHFFRLYVDITTSTPLALTASSFSKYGCITVVKMS